MLTNKQLSFRIKELDDYLLEKYRKAAKKEAKKKKKDYAKYERDYMRRIKTVIRELDPMIKEATNIKIHRGRGKPPKLTLEQRMRIFLIKQLIDKSNRNMAYMLDLFCLVMGIDISYKTIERLYSNEDLKLALYNLHILLLQKKEVRDVDCGGDATGYGLVIRKHYASYVQKLKDKAKKQDGRKKKKHFAYKFTLIDLRTKMYICYGSSLKSEKRAYKKAMKMLEELKIKVKSIRLDKYYSFPSYVKYFKGIKMFIIPRKNAKLGHGEDWLKVMNNFVNDTWEYLKEYYKRNLSENGFGVDKKMFGSKIRQKREDRIDTAIFAKVLWHNLIYLYL
ncbi:MAG: ISNCY family transposase [Nanoarchaeota archaeon]|nr:ISNCY family transposase [Nanoarchaeota archaeon]